MTDRRSKPLTQEEKQADIIIINIFVNIFVNNKLPVMTFEKLDAHQDQVDEELVWVVSQVVPHVPENICEIFDVSNIVLQAPH